MPYWEPTQSIEHDDISVDVNRRMTEYEASKWRDRADRLLEELRNGLPDYEIEHLVAYGSSRRIGVRLGRTDDPLRNGIMTGNVEGFDVEAVSPVNHDTVFVRFQEQPDN